MLESSSHNFDLALTADELYDYTLEICGKQEDDEGNKTYRFPMYTYPNYVSRILDTAGDIHQDIIVANESFDFEERIRLENDAIGKCVYLNHLTRLAGNRGWISEKQLNRWRKLTNAVYWLSHNWRKSDRARLEKQ